MARLFHCLVVCGTGLTLLQCGGRSRSDEEGADAGAGGLPGGTSGSAGAASGRGATAGTSPLGDAGALALGGAPGIGGGYDHGTPPEVAAQWRCAVADHTCRGGGIDLTNTLCEVEPNRPRSPADCSPPEVFACIQGWKPEGALAFNCECLPPGADGACVCPVIDATFEVAASCTPEAGLCGCAITCILIPK